MNYYNTLILTLSSLLIIFFSVNAKACDFPVNDSCETAVELTFTTSTICEQGCTLEASHGRFDRSSQGCNGSPFGTVWYKVEAPSLNSILNLELKSSDLVIPMVTVYTGDCSALAVLDCNQRNLENVYLRNLKLEAGETYYLAVSSADGSEGEFDVCYSLINDPNVCNTANQIEVKNTSKGSPLYGPYQSDEVVEICYTINGYVNMSCNYLQAIQPIFGEGWSATSFDTEGQPLVITQNLVTQGNTSFTTANPVCEGDPAGTWNWYPQGEIQYNLNSENPMNFVYNDNIDGSWVFLNAFDPSCFDFDDACCTNPTADPNLGYGDDDYPLCGRGMTQSWTICFELTTALDCAEDLDCMVGLKTYSDGEVGAYISKACSSDLPSYVNATVSCRTAPAVTASDVVINVCAGESFGFDVESDSDARIYWFDADDVLHVADGFSTTITGQHDLEGQYLYVIYASNGQRSEPLNIEVNVSSELKAYLVQEPEKVCIGEPVTISVVVDGVTDMDQLAYSWNNAQSIENSLEVMAESASEVSLEVSFGLCSADLSSAINLFDESTLEIGGDDAVCKEDMATIRLSFSGEAPWTIRLENNHSFSEEMIIDDTTYELPFRIDRETEFRVVEATDGNGCAARITNEHTVALASQPQISAGQDRNLNCDAAAVVLEGSVDMQLLDYVASWYSLQSQEVLDEGMNTEVTEAGSYVLTVQDLVTGCMSLDTVVVSENENDLVLDLSTETYLEIEQGESLDLEVFYNRSDSDVQFINWSGDSSIDCVSCAAVTVSPNSDVTYTVEVMDLYNCVQERTIFVKVNQRTPKVYLPNIFQPGLKGNEAFQIFDNETLEEVISFEIFDRWGKVVHAVYGLDASEDIILWDGKSNGVDAEAGVYVYKMSLKYLQDADKERIVGTVTLLK